jgi:DNA end-binding protein Ku
VPADAREPNLWHIACTFRGVRRLLSRPRSETIVPRPIWQGSLSFGLVAIPVGLYPAETPDDLNLDLLDKRNMARVGYDKINKETGEPVPSEELVKGYALESGHYVVVTDQEIKGASPAATQTIDIVEFVEAKEIDSIYFDRPYFLAPGKHGENPFALLREALRRTRKVGVARLVVRTREYVAAVYPWQRTIVVHLLRYQHELRDPGLLDLPAAGASKPGVGTKELDMAERLIDGMVEAWDPSAFKDDYRKKLLDLIHKKAEAGEEWEVPEVEPSRPKAPVVDLMALLKKSVEQKARAGTAHKQRATARARGGATTARGKRRAGSTRRSA